MAGEHVLVIGGGGTGGAIIHDLTRRGYKATLVERGELTAGTTGRHHGQLHSGARYAVGDRDIARECMEEVRILQKIAPQSLEMNYGLFVAVDDEEAAYGDEFIAACNEATIPAHDISVEQALEMEPFLSPGITRAVQVPDGTLDAWRLPLHFFATAQSAGATIRNFTEVIGLNRSQGRVTGARVVEHATRREYDIEADFVINATGAWAGQICAMADIDVPITPAPGTMVSVKKRLNNMVVSRLHPAGDGDIIVPQRKLSIIGSTQWQTDDPDSILARHEDIEFLIGKANEMMPSFGDAGFHAAWSAVRPLAGRAEGSDGRGLSRDFICINHEAEDGVPGFMSVTGGKATVLRAMAEKTVDTLCRIVGNDTPCTTADAELLPHRAFFNPSLA
ncbi:MAG: FAD-dependent oxidoreductase [Spirochaetes bacterium]|jgi:glycerol-3-phosphate dehydrogenase|nr:FAD-dependent oxidoreductase [Spirochaetota bacterium]